MSEQRLAQLTQALRATPVAIQEKGKTRIGVAVPGQNATTDLYLVRGATEARNFGAISELMQKFLPAILGVLEMNRLACEGASTERADISAMLNIVAAESADLLLQQSGTLSRTQQVARPLVASGDIRTAMHLVHHEKNDAVWQSQLRKTVESSGGLEQIEQRKGLGADQLRALRAVEVGGVSLSVDTTKDNLLVVQAYADQVAPRLQATGLEPEKLVQVIMDAQTEAEPIREVIHRATGVPVRKSWSVR